MNEPLQLNLTRLINYSLSEYDNSQKEELFNYYSRILNSDMTILTDQESSIINNIFNKLSVEKQTRFQALYKKLSMMKNKLSRRWALFYFLNQLSTIINEENQSKNSQGIFSMLINNQLTKLDDKNNNYFQKNQIETKEQSQNVYALNNTLHGIKDSTKEEKEKDKYQSVDKRLVVNKYKTNKIITEKDIIHDLIYVFQGIDGNYINFSSLYDCYMLNQLIPFKDNVIEIVNHLTEIGWLFKKTKEILDYFHGLNIQSQTLQAFTYAMQHELDQYYKLISYFNQSTNIEKDSENAQEVTLKRLYLWTIEPMEKMKWLAIVSEACMSLRGIPIVSQLYSYVKYTYANQLKGVLFTTSQPFFTMIRDWIIYGQINDSSSEFFVKINKIKEEDKIWSEKYSIIYENIPNFSDKEFYYKIFEIGKTVHFIKNHCGKFNQFNLLTIKDKLILEEEEFEKVEGSQEVNKKIIKKPLNLIFSKEPLNCLLDLPFLKREIDIIHYEINAYLVKLLQEEFLFNEHLKMINCYLLMGQGDMMQYLMELLIEELSKPVSHLQKHTLRSKLDTAISSSNAQYHKFKYNVDVKIDDSIGDIGWDVFCLQYNITLPLNIIFNNKNMQEYQKLFYFFWKIKRLEYSNNHEIWRKIMTQSHLQKNEFDKIRPYINKTMLFNQQVIHFISTFHNYITLEVLETQTKKLHLKLKQAKNVNEIISIHNTFVEKIIEQCLLNSDNSIIYKNIINIFEIIIKFKTLFDILNNSIIENFIRFQEMKKYGDDLYDEAYLKQNKKCLDTAYEQINICFNDFKNNVSSLIQTLDVVGKGSFKYLSMKLDYNGYYSDLEMRKYDNNNRGNMNKGNEMDIDEENKDDLDKYDIEYNKYSNEDEIEYKENNLNLELDNILINNNSFTNSEPIKLYSKGKIVQNNMNSDYNIEEYLASHEAQVKLDKETNDLKGKSSKIFHDNN